MDKIPQIRIKSLDICENCDYTRRDHSRISMFRKPWVCKSFKRERKEK